MAEDIAVDLPELLAEVRRIELSTKRLVTDVMAGGYSSVFRGSGIEFEEVREYAPGDDPRSIDWNVTARLGRPFVKKYVDERELTLMFLLDVSASGATGLSEWSPRQMAMRVCACLAMTALRNNDKIGLITFDSEVRHHVGPRKGLGQLLRIVRDGLAAPSRPAATDLRAVTEFVSRFHKRHTILFLISDFFVEDGWQEPLARCARNHDVIAVRMLPNELEQPPRGIVRQRDPESGAERVIDWDDPERRRDYAARVATWKKSTARELEGCQVDLMDVPVPRRADRRAVARPVLDFFRRRGGSRRSSS